MAYSAAKPAMVAVTAVAMTMVMLVGYGGEAADTSNCQSLITNLLPCLPYVQGKASVPAKQCCEAVLPIHLNQPQCLCELIVAAADHESSLPDLNVSLAISLGPACNIKTDPSRCPGLLNLTPGSSEANIFPPAASNSTATGPSPASTSNSTTPATPLTMSQQQTSFSPTGVVPSLAGGAIISFAVVLSALVL